MESYYYLKYIKYKTKYLAIGGNSNCDCGFSNGNEWLQMVKERREKNPNDCNCNCPSGEEWTKMLKMRETEVSKMTTTNSYLSKNDLLNKDISCEIHDNGGRPFIVKSDKGVIYINENSCDESQKTENIMKISDYDGLWVGYDISPDRQHGNSILIKLSKTNYIFVGCIIYSFDTNEEIIEFISDVGGINDVTTPMAYSDTYIYDFCKRQYINKNDSKYEANIVNASNISIEMYDLDKNKLQQIKNIKQIRDRNESGSFLGLYKNIINNIITHQ